MVKFQGRSFSVNQESTYLGKLVEKSVKIERIAGILPCPCGNTAHGRYNVDRFKKIFSDFSVHPTSNELGESYADPYPHLYVNPRSGASASPPTSDEMISQFSSLQVDSIGGPSSVAELLNENSAQSHTEGEDIEMDGTSVSVVNFGDNIDEGEEQQWEDEPAVGMDSDTEILAVEGTTIHGGEMELDAPMEGNLPPVESSDDDSDLDTELTVDEHPASPPPPPSNELVQDLISQYAPDPDDINENAARKFLQDHRIVVDPIQHWTICLQCRLPIQWTMIYKHRRGEHHSRFSRLSRTAGAFVDFPSEEEITRNLLILQAEKPTEYSLRTITRVEGLDVKTCVKCLFPGCGKIYGSKPSFDKHWTISQSHIGKRCSAKVKVHPLGGMMFSQQFIEVTGSPHSLDSDKVLQKVLALAKERGIGDSPTIAGPPGTASAMNQVYNEFRWNEIIEGAVFEDVRVSALIPLPSDEPDYYRIVQGAHFYYWYIIPKLESLGTTVRRWIRSLRPSEIRTMPFRRLQEKSSMDQNANVLATFLVFLLRNTRKPIPNFRIALHPSAKAALIVLGDQAKEIPGSGADDQKLYNSNISIAIHDAVWTFLSNPAAEFLVDRQLCPLLRFFVASHIRDAIGTLGMIAQVTPRISKIQWCFRATGCNVIILRREEFDNEEFKTYETLVQKYLMDGPSTPFTTMRETKNRFSRVIASQPTISRFTWDVDSKVVSMDGTPISVQKLFDSWQTCLADLETATRKVFRGYDYTPILELIDSKTIPIPEESSNWFVDSRSQLDYLYSFLEEDRNQLKPYREVLLQHLLKDASLITVVNGELIPNENAIWQWFADLQDSVNLKWYLTHVSSPGTGRGREWENIYYANHPSHSKNLHCLNGTPCYEPSYGKTQAVKGYTDCILRTPAWQVMRYDVLILDCAYVAASHLGNLIGMKKEFCDNYLYRSFVRYGRPMVSADFSKFLQHITQKTIGVPLGLLDYRQLDTAILNQIAHLSLEKADLEDAEVEDMHLMSGHSAQTARNTYGVSHSSATPSIPQDLVASQQRKARVWQGVIGMLHPRLRIKAASISPNSSGYTFSPEIMEQVVAPIVKSAVDESTRTILRGLHSEIRELKSFITGTYTSGIHQFLEIVTGSGPAPFYDAPPVPISRGLKEFIHQQCFPHLETFSFHSPQQAEAIASVQTKDHIFIVLPTGGGKSHAFLAAPLVQPGVYIVIFPLISIVNEMKLRADKLPIQAVIWGEDDFDFSRPGLIFVAVHMAATEKFRAWIKLEEVYKHIRRIFIDECHHIITDRDFRLCYDILVFLTELGILYTWLSATLRPSDMPIIVEALQIPGDAVIREIRSYTGRLNHIYTHQRVAVKELEAAIVDWVRPRATLEGKRRGLVYVSSRKECEGIAKLLGVEFFHSQLDPDRKRSLALQWRDGSEYNHRILVCTSAYGEGIDWPEVVWVLSINPFGIISLVQWEGRAGRNGQPAECHTIFTRLPRVSVNDVDSKGAVALVRRLTGGECVRLSQASLDRESHSCSALRSAQLCQNCNEAPMDNLSGVPTINLQNRLLKWPDSKPAVDPTIPVSSIASGVIPLRKKFAARDKAIEKFERILDQISGRGCIFCFVDGTTHQPDTVHQPYNRFELIRNKFSNSDQSPTFNMKANIHVPFCFHCWIPFHQVGSNHPNPEPGEPWDTERCPYNQIQDTIIPSLIAYIWSKAEMIEKVEIKLGLSWKDRNGYYNSETLWKWLTSPVGATELQPPYAFVNAFFDTCISIE
ncbi:hypothetical protein BDP27DRAFT_1428161 [Rhodocollybia butyracea]|uniref:DNA 3'-5' helicase n=1 Tax=Rhodocollybia butyracea TaxID=206335 RepID=A0A9P5PBY6_9AGAR|nr:hypothetical protein BDP27DRAFT_1428161 [Rhodocollybia butyracea]